MVYSATSAQTLWRHFLVLQCHVVHGMHVHLLSFIPIRKYNWQSNNRIMCSHVHGISPKLHSKCREYTHTFIHATSWGTAVTVPIFTKHAINQKIFAKITCTEFDPHKQNTYKIQSKYHLHCSVDYGFHHFCFQVSPPKLCTQFSSWKDPHWG
jgi:hypothetical protein